MVPNRSHGGHWSVVAAAVGCLALIDFAALAQPPDGQRVAQPSPSVEGKAQREAQPGYRPPEPPPVPVRIVKSPGEAAGDAAREAKSDEHDVKDLDAQIRAAD